jgi:hypothetical protein
MCLFLKITLPKTEAIIVGGGVRDGYLTVFTLSRDITGISHF